MSHKRKQYEANKQRNFVAKHNVHKGGVHGKTYKAERKQVHDILKQEVYDDEILEGRIQHSDGLSGPDDALVN